MVREWKRHVRCHVRRAAVLRRNAVVARLVEMRRKRRCTRRWRTLVKLLVLPGWRWWMRARTGSIGWHTVAIIGRHTHHARRWRAIVAGSTHASAWVAMGHGRRRRWTVVVQTDRGSSRVNTRWIRRSRWIACKVGHGEHVAGRHGVRNTKRVGKPIHQHTCVAQEQEPLGKLQHADGTKPHQLRATDVQRKIHTWTILKSVLRQVVRHGRMVVSVSVVGMSFGSRHLRCHLLAIERGCHVGWE